MEVSKVSENAGMTALKYSNKCKIGVNAFKKYDLCGKIIKLNTLKIYKCRGISGCYGISRDAVLSVNSVNAETGESGYE